MYYTSEWLKNDLYIKINHIFGNKTLIYSDILNSKTIKYTILNFFILVHFIIFVAVQRLIRDYSLTCILLY